MARIRISALTQTTLDGTDFAPVVQNSTTFKARITALPTGATDNAILRADGTAGFKGQTSAVRIDDSGNITPVVTDAGGLGTSSLQWSDAFFASGAVINFAAGDVTITHSSNVLTFAGAASGYQFTGGAVQPATNDGVALGTTTVSWADLFLASGGVVNWNNGNYTLTHSAGNLTAVGGPFAAPSFVPSGSTVPTNGLYLPAANTLGFAASSAAEVQLTSGAFSPAVSDGNALGTTSLQWADLFLAEGGVINWDNGDATITQTGDTIAFAGITALTAIGATISGDALNVISATAALTLICTGAGASTRVGYLGARRTVPANNDDAYLSLYLQDSTVTDQLVGNIKWKLTNVTSGAENGKLIFEVTTAGATAAEVEITGTAMSPSTSDGNALGTTALQWSDLFLASGGVISFASTDWVATHTTGILTVGTGDLRITTAGTNAASVVTVGGTQTLTNKTLTSPTINSPALSSPTITGSPTAAGATWADLGGVTTADINGGTVDGTVIGGASAAAITGTLITGNRFVPNSATVPTNGMYLPAANTLGWAVNSAAEMQLTATALSPAANDGNALGTSALQWGDLFLATGGVISFANTDWVATHTTGILTVGTGDLRVTTAGTNSASVVTVGGTQTLTAKTLTSPVINTGTIGTSLLPTANDGAALGASGTAFADLFLASGGVVNFNAGNVTLTHAAGLLTVAGGGIVLAAGTTTLAPLAMTAGTALTTPAAGAFEYTTNNASLYFSPVASARHTVDVEQWVRPTAVVALSNSATTAQNIFPSTSDVLTVGVGAYFFEILLFINTGATTHTTALGLVASANLTGINYFAELWSTTAGTISTTAPSVLNVTTDGATVLNATSTATRTTIRACGELRMSGAATITPQITFSAGPTGTCEIAVGSYMRIWSMDRATNGTVFIGNWA